LKTPFSALVIPAFLVLAILSAGCARLDGELNTKDHAAIARASAKERAEKLQKELDAIQVPPFILESELRVLPQPMVPGPMSTAGMKKNEIAITLDDGPSPEFNSFILKTLREHGVKATFFVVGWRAEKYPELVKAILREGHSVANHSWHHPQMNRLKASSAKSEITSTQAVLDRISEEVGIPVQPFFRFPYGAGINTKSLQKTLIQLNMANFFWSMSMKDSETQDEAVALKTAIGMLDKYQRGIFLMHETHVAGVKALPKLLLELKQRNFKTIYYQAAPPR
jgi:peptidoglycan/xylan/chitin deacetylase (PgdA/CDA1 family)